MKSISIPFRFSGGGVAVTTDIAKITEQKIIDIFTTAPNERAIDVGYGLDIRSLLYEPMDSLAFDDFKEDALTKINENLDVGRVTDMVITYPDSPQMAFPEDSTISVTVRYIIPPYNGREFTFDVSSDV